MRLVVLGQAAGDEFCGHQEGVGWDGIFLLIEWLYAAARHSSR